MTKTTAVARVGSNAGRGHGSNGGGDVVPPSGAGRRKARQEVGAGGCGVGFSIGYYLQVCPQTPLNPLFWPKLHQKSHPESSPQIHIYSSVCLYGSVIGVEAMANNYI